MENIRSLRAQLPRGNEAPAWYAFRTRFRRERTVASRLAALGFECYVPIATRVRHYPSGRRVVRVPLLAGYVFVRLTANDYTAVLSDADVYEIVSFRGEVGRVTDAEIAFLKLVMGGAAGSEEEFEVELRERIVVGTPVVISGGTLAGTRGRVTGRRGRHNFEVELKTLGVSLVLTVAEHLLARELSTS